MSGDNNDLIKNSQTQSIGGDVKNGSSHGRYRYDYPIPPENQKMSKKSKRILFSVIGVSVIVIGSMIALITSAYISANTNWTATQIVEKMEPLVSTMESYKDFKDIDSDNIYGKENSYTSKLIIFDSTLVPRHETDWAATVEVFNNSTDAGLRKWYIEKQYESMNRVSGVEKYGEYFRNLSHKSDDTVYIDGNALLRLSNKLSDDTKESYINSFHSIKSQYKETQELVPDEERIEEIKNERLVYIASIIESYDEGFFQAVQTSLEEALDILDEYIAYPNPDSQGQIEDLELVESLNVPAFEDLVNELKDKAAQLRQKYEEMKR